MFALRRRLRECLSACPPSRWGAGLAVGAQHKIIFSKHFWHFIYLWIIANVSTTPSRKRKCGSWLCGQYDCGAGKPTTALEACHWRHTVPPAKIHWNSLLMEINAPRGAPAAAVDFAKCFSKTKNYSHSYIFIQFLLLFCIVFFDSRLIRNVGTSLSWRWLRGVCVTNNGRDSGIF